MTPDTPRTPPQQPLNAFPISQRALVLRRNVDEPLFQTLRGGAGGGGPGARP